MRSGFQNSLEPSRIRVWDAAGANPILIVDLDQTVPNHLTGDRVLIASSSFVTATNPDAAPDFTMTSFIPPSYLAADFARCAACLAGPDGILPAGCTSEEFAACDLHEDSDVDLLDVAELVLVVSAP